MVENQHSINTILSFGAKSVNPEILEKLLIGREKTADYLFNAVKSIAEDGNNNQQLIIGQRGMGKTHLFRILFHRIQNYIVANKLVVAYFSEEEYGVANYFDFLTRIINAIIKWNDIDKEALQQKLEELQETQAKAQVNVAEKIIEDYIGKRPLLILAENFSDILESIKPAEQSKLRAWMYKVNRISIIASSQSISKDFDREDRPFYGFFNLYYLKNLDFEGSLEFLISLAKLDKRDDVVKHLENKGRGQVKAIHQLVKGNHRLLVTFYEFLKTDTLAKLSSHFIKTINDLKPYYETYIRYLPAQQQKILRYVALSRKPQQGTDISRNCFIDSKSLSKQMSELDRKNLIEILTDTDDKRNKLYDILEPLLRISIEVGEHREGITSIFIDFLAIYYNENELSDRKNKFHNLLNDCDSHNERLEFNYEIQAIDRALELKKTVYKNIDKSIQEIFDEIYIFFDNKDWDSAQNTIEQNKNILTKAEYNGILADFYYGKKDFNKALEIFNKSERENQIHPFAYNNWGNLLAVIGELSSNQKFFIESFEKFSISTNLITDDYNTYYNWAIALYELASIKKDKKLYVESIEKYEIASKLNPNYKNIYTNWGISLIELAELNMNKKTYQLGLEKFKIAIELEPNQSENYQNYGNGLCSYGKFINDEEIINKSLLMYEKALDLDPNLISTYYNFGISISDYNFIFNDSKINFNKIKTALFEGQNIENRIEIFNFFAKTKNNYLFMNLWEIISKDIKYLIDIKSELLINWITNILIEKRNKLNSEKIAFLKKITEQYKNDIPELLIVEKYLEVYEEYVINGNKKSLYNLPKEQRNFFKENILN